MPLVLGLVLAAVVSGCALVTRQALAIPVEIAPPSLESGAGVTGIAVQHPMGQSFLANGDSINTIELLLINLNMSFDLSQDHYVTVDLFKGIGFDGAHLGSTSVNVDQILGRLAGTQSTVNFAFNGTPALPGEMYTFQISAATARFGSAWFSGDRYTYGQAILRDEPFADPDLYFAISTVPEPSPRLLIITGLLLIISIIPHTRLTEIPGTSRGSPSPIGAINDRLC